MSAIPHSTAGMLLLLLPPRNRRSSINDRQHGSHADLDKSAGRLLRNLQTVQNAAARVVTRSRKFDHITPVLHELHWLPMVQRVRFKLALIVFKCLHGLAPSYLTDDCVLVSSVY